VSTARIQPLDGLRGLAIVFVLVGHTVLNYGPMSETLRWQLIPFANAEAGVRLFFVLSGYLITLLLLDEQSRTGQISLRQFYWRRALRIMPAFYVYLLAVVLLDRWRPHSITSETGLAAATFTWNYALLWVTDPPEGHWFVGHLWTLSLEQQFYLFWPAVLIAVGVRRALWVAVALILWCPLARVGSYWLFPAQRGLLQMMLHTGVDSLMAGCAAALILQDTRARTCLGRYGSKGAVAAAGWLLLLSPTAGTLIRGFPVVAGFTLDALAAAWVVAWAHHATGSVATRWLGSGPLPALGAISYSLYLWQQIFFAPTGLLQDGWVIVPAIAALAAAWLSYRLVEKPALRLKSRWIRAGAEPAAS
jgi:peptidoglycan/LPS O-acetylase OafA/YrhL